MHSLFVVALAATLAFVGTMFDNFFAFAAQLVLSERERHARVSWAHAASITLLVIVAAGVGSVLSAIPLRLVGLLAVAPLALAIHAFRHRVTRPQYRRGIVATFALTFSLGGDNIAVWVPLLRASGVGHGALTVAIFALWELIFLLGAQALARHERVVAWGEQIAPTFMPWLYLALSVAVLLECHTL